MLKKTCLLAVASTSLSPKADSTTTCVMYSFKVSERQSKPKSHRFSKQGRRLKTGCSGAYLVRQPLPALMNSSCTRWVPAGGTVSARFKKAQVTRRATQSCCWNVIIHRHFNKDRRRSESSRAEELNLFDCSFHQSAFLWFLIFSNWKSDSCALNKKNVWEKIPHCAQIFNVASYTDRHEGSTKDYFFLFFIDQTKGGGIDN